MQIEVWRKITAFDNYEVSSFGNVRNVETGRVLKPRKHGKIGKYMCVNLSLNGDKYTFKVHSLVAQEFIPKPLGLDEVDHKDNNGRNNHVDNLRWCNKSQNGANRRKAKEISGKQTSSIHKGLWYNERKQRWIMSIMKDGKTIRRNFKTEIDAAKAYNEFATKLFGEFALLNEV